MKNLFGFVFAAGIALSVLGGFPRAENEALVGFWAFDEGQGTIAHDSSQSGSDGTIYGAAWVEGMRGKALKFDGIDDYVDTNYLANLGTGDFTVETWVRPDVATASFGRFLNKYQPTPEAGFAFGFWGNTGTLLFEFPWLNYLVTPGEPLVASNWYHVAAVRSGTNKYVYINGILEASATIPQTDTLDNPYTVTIGGQPGRGWSYSGVIDEVRIYGRALSAEELAAHYEQNAPIRATVDIDPDAVNLKSEGKWITAYIELPAGYDAANIVVGTVTLDNAVPAEQKPATLGDYDRDGIPDLAVKFDRNAAGDAVGAGAETTILVGGRLSDGQIFEGRDEVRIVNPRPSKGGLAGYWAFDEGEGTVAHDSSRNGSDGTIYGAAWVEGMRGKALSFDGVDDYVDTNFLANFGTGDFTVETWVRPDVATASFGRFLNKYQPTPEAGFAFGFWGNTGALLFEFPWLNYLVTPGEPLLAGNWYHVAAVRSGTNKYVYINGILEASATIPQTDTLNNPYTVTIGGQPGRGWSYSGVIDEVRIHDRALSAREINASRSRVTGDRPIR